MTRTPSSRDWELLSAYLDGELEDRSRARLETRLQKEDALARALKRIERSRALLRRSPVARAPRDFKLTPQMIAQPGGFFSGFSFSPAALSAAASLLLVIVLAGDLLMTGAPIALLAGADAAQQNEPMMAMEAAEESTAADAVEDQGEGDAAADSFAFDAEGDDAAEGSDEAADSAEAEQLEPAADLAREQEPASTSITFLGLLEFALAGVALLSGLIAWRRRVSSPG